MLKPRRLTAAVVSALLLAALAACGGEAKPGYGDDTVSGFEGVEVTGDFGKEPTLKWNGVIEYPEETKVKTLIEGDGEEIPASDQVGGSMYLGNGTTLEKEWVYSSGMQGGSDTETISAETGPVFKEMLDGAKVGDRIIAIAPSEEMFGEAGNPELGVGTRDSIVLVIDVKKNAGPDPASIEPKDVPADEMPSVVEKNGKPSSLDFSGVAEPNGDLKRTVLTEGEGAEVKGTDTVQVRYLGQVYGGKKPFDSNQTKKGFEANLAGGVVQGWTTGLTGMTEGSRVMLEVPPVVGYGEEGNANIKGDDTMFFVVDIVKIK